jgi:hypothetical protein
MSAANDQTAGTAVMVPNSASCVITGDPVLDGILDRMSIFGNNLVADAFRQMLALFPPPPVLVVDEDESDDNNR